MKTALNNRFLFFDGTVQVEPDRVPDLLLQGVPIDKIRITATNELIEEYNRLVDDPLIPTEPTDVWLDKSWQIPDSFLRLDVRQHVLELAAPLGKKYVDRADEELDHIERKKLVPLIQTLMFIISEFKRTGVVYGVGRGSSCASLVLYLIGLHRVDPIKYSIPLQEFFHD